MKMIRRLALTFLVLSLGARHAGAAEAPGEIAARVERLAQEVARLSALTAEQGRALEQQRALIEQQGRDSAMQQAALNSILSELAASRGGIAAAHAGRAGLPSATVPELAPAPGAGAISVMPATLAVGREYVLASRALFTPQTPQQSAGPSAGAGDNTSDTATERVTRLENTLAEARKTLDDRLRGFGPFSFSGDFRYRHEPFFGGGPSDGDSPPDRFRNRLRLRVNAATRFDDEFSGGIMLASGIGGNPVSANQDLTGYFTEKPFSIDRAFISYNPRWARPLRVIAGKWAYTFRRTQMMWDNDLNPEGVTETLAFNWKDSPLQRLELTAFQTVMLEVANAPDSSLLGWQLSTDWKLLPRLKLNTALTFFDYNNEASLASNVNGGNGSYDAGQPTGFGGNYGFGASTLTNSFSVINGVRVLASKYGIVDLIARLDIDTGAARWPLMLEGDFAQNTRSCQNLGVFAVAGAAVPACNPRDRQAYWIETILGRNQEKGEWAFGYTFARIERDALLSTFNFSNFRQGTHQASHRMEAIYSINRNVTGTARAIIGRQLGKVSGVAPGARVVERNLTRLQFDLIYRY